MKNVMMEDLEDVSQIAQALQEDFFATEVARIQNQFANACLVLPKLLINARLFVEMEWLDQARPAMTAQKAAANLTAKA